jgi:hypothetical protein
MARAGLKRVVKTVKGKKRSVRRTYWVKSSAASKKPSGLMAKARNIAGNHYLQSALVGAASGAFGRVNTHRAQKKDYEANPRRPGSQFGANSLRSRVHDAAGYVGAHAVTQVLAGRRKADRWGTALATLGGNMAGEWAAGKMVRHPQNATNWMKW